MHTFVLNKLVRDNIVPNMERAGIVVNFMALTKKDLLEALQMKVQEEFEELQETLWGPTEAIIGELADVQEVIEARTEAGGNPRGMMPYQNEVNDTRKKNKISMKELCERQADKKKKKWGFKEGHFIATVTLSEDNPRYKYISEKYEKKK